MFVSDEAQRARSVIVRQTEQLSRLVDDLLDVTRITRNKVRLQRERLDLNELVRRTTDDHRSLFENNGIRIEFSATDKPADVSADSNRLAQVLGNLLQNAAKFTHRGGKVSVSLEIEPAGDWASIRVADSGVGIAPQALAKLFHPFVQAHTTVDHTKGGLGLGLALVKGIVELHGGEVTARSDGLGKGAEFLVRLPLAPERVSHEPTAAPTSVATRVRRVLIIDDNIDAAETLRSLLELWEHEVSVAYSGPEGMAKAREFRPDAVVCDIGLPGMDGFEVARAARRAPQRRGTRRAPPRERPSWHGWLCAGSSLPCLDTLRHHDAHRS